MTSEGDRGACVPLVRRHCNEELVVSKSGDAIARIFQVGVTRFAQRAICAVRVFDLGRLSLLGVEVRVAALYLQTDRDLSAKAPAPHQKCLHIILGCYRNLLSLKEIRMVKLHSSEINSSHPNLLIGPEGTGPSSPGKMMCGTGY